MLKHFVTFGQEHLDVDGLSLQDSYIIVEADDFSGIREKIFELRGDKFAFEYPIEKLEFYLAKWHPMFKREHCEIALTK